ncbi:hypothetical protein J7E95_32200 [Streptomyces sp. ISL-14]|nr:hypothetical protein [Streptomyces sp. ISL-14]
MAATMRSTAEQLLEDLIGRIEQSVVTTAVPAGASEGAAQIPGFTLYRLPPHRRL